MPLCFYNKHNNIIAQGNALGTETRWADNPMLHYDGLWLSLRPPIFNSARLPYEHETCTS